MSSSPGFGLYTCVCLISSDLRGLHELFTSLGVCQPSSIDVVSRRRCRRHPLIRKNIFSSETTYTNKKTLSK